MSRETLRKTMRRFTRPMTLVADEGRGRMRCLACGHRCLVPPGREGVCKVRFNDSGVLMGPWGYVAGLQDDPIEKKPFTHAVPGSRALSFGMLGCDFHCSYCQNWVTSQALRDDAALASVSPISAEEIIVCAKRLSAHVVTSTYNEPLITAEWGAEVFRLAKNAGMITSMVSNGNNTAECVEMLKPVLDMCNVDLKSFQDKNYRKLGGTLQGVLDGIIRLHAAGIWMEVVTLVVPGMNDSPAELRAMAEFIAGVDPGIPWHVTAFHPDYRMTDGHRTPAQKLIEAYRIGREAGLHFVYPGNVHGQMGNLENTACPYCGVLLVERRGYAVLGYHLRDGHCPGCSASIPGFWHSAETLPFMELAAPGRVGVGQVRRVRV